MHRLFKYMKLNNDFELQINILPEINYYHLIYFNNFKPDQTDWTTLKV